MTSPLLLFDAKDACFLLHAVVIMSSSCFYWVRRHFRCDCVAKLDRTKLQSAPTVREPYYAASGQWKCDGWMDTYSSLSRCGVVTAVGEVIIEKTDTARHQRAYLVLLRVYGKDKLS